MDKSMGILDGFVEPTLIRDPIRRLCSLVDLSRPHGISTAVPLHRFCLILTEMYSLADVYADEGQIEKAFVLYLRFVGIVVEELPKHKDYASFSVSEKEQYDRLTIRAMNAAEMLKRKIKTIYEADAAKLISTQKDDDKSKNDGPSIARPLPVLPPLLGINLKSYVVCKKKSDNSFLFARIVIPNDLPQKFLQQFENESPETTKFAVLYGKLIRGSLIISHALVTDDTAQDAFDHLERSIVDRTNNEEPSELFIAGCIAGSYSEASMDRFVSRSILTEIVCIVVGRGDCQTYVLHLSNIPERKQNDQFISNATQAAARELEKQHTPNQNENNFHHACHSICSHTHITPSLSCSFVNRRTLNEATSQEN